MQEITFSIVGTAGRGDDQKKLDKNHFKAMCVVASTLLEEFESSNYGVTHLVSGGAAFADHVAVSLFLQNKAKNLKLFLPCEWDNYKFKDNGKDNFSENPGKTANYYHDKFQRNTGINSLSEIRSAQLRGATLINGKGFHARNALVAKSDFILACTFGDGPELKDGGTADTIEKYLKRVKKDGFFDKSFHYNLNDGVVYVGAKVPAKTVVDDLKSALQYAITKNKLILPTP